MREVNVPETGAWMNHEELGAIYERLLRFDVIFCTEIDLAGEIDLYSAACAANTRTIREAMLQ